MSNDTYPSIYESFPDPSAYDQDFQPTEQHVPEGWVAPLAGQMSSNPVHIQLKQPQPKRSKNPLMACLLISIFVIVFGLVVLETHTYLPASTATVTLVPLQQPLNQTYTFSLAMTSKDLPIRQD